MKTPKSKKSSQHKKLKYNPNHYHHQKLWNIQKILDDRIKLKPIKQTKIDQNTMKQITVIKYVTQKQYEIAWQQNCSSGLWPNTWQPQQNIPDFTRLDYLLKKRSQLLNQKKLGRQSRMKSKQNYQQHLQFIAKNSMLRSQEQPSLLSRRQNAKKIIEKKQKAGNTPPKIIDYKNWFISYNSKLQWFEKIIQRFLKGEKNLEIQIIKKQEKDNKIKSPLKKQELLNIFEKKQASSIKTQQNANVFKDLPQQNLHLHHNRSHALPQMTSDYFVKQVHYIGNADYVDYFRLKLFDDTVSYVSEQDFVEYFPFAYQNYLKKQIYESVDDALKTLKELNVKQDFQHKKCVQNIGLQIGLHKQDFNFQNEKQNIFYPKRDKSNSTDYSQIFGNQPYSAQNDQEKLQQKESNNPQTSLNNPQALNKRINNYFTFIKQLNPSQPQGIQYDILQNKQTNQFNKNSKNNFPFQSTQCKALFKVYQQKQSKQSPKKNDHPVTTSSKGLKIQNIEKPMEKQPHKKIKIQSNPTTKNKISIQSGKIIITKQEKQKNKKETIKQNSTKKLPPNSNSNISRILNDEKQIFEILNVLQKPSKHQDDFYDSDDQNN